MIKINASISKVFPTNRKSSRTSYKSGWIAIGFKLNRNNITRTKKTKNVSLQLNMNILRDTYAETAIRISEIISLMQHQSIELKSNIYIVAYAALILSTQNNSPQRHLHKDRHQNLVHELPLRYLCKDCYRRPQRHIYMVC